MSAHILVNIFANARGRALAALRPPPRLPLSDWIETAVRLPAGLAAVPGPVKLWPWQRDIADAIGDAECERVTMLKGTRLGFSTLLVAAIGHHVANDPAPVLLLQPTESDCRDVMVSDIEPLFAASPALAGLLREPGRTMGERDTILHRLFPGGSLKIVAARAPRNLRRHTARILFCDEIDAMEITAEGDPLTLAERRTLSFSNRKIVMGSTPLLADTSNVIRLYERSDQRIFEVPCPRCGAFTEIRWRHIEWESARPETAAFRCEHCEKLVPESAMKPRMVEAGRWRATKPEVRGHRGYRLNALVSLLEKAAWGVLAAEFLQAKNDSAELQAWTNTVLAEGWREQADEADELELQSRAEAIGLDNIPADVLAVTVGADVQDDRLESTITGWTRGGDALILDHVVTWGSPQDDETWKEFDDLLRSRWPHPHGGTLRVDAACIDAGDGGHFDAVCRFCAPRLSRKILAIKGVAGFGRPALVPTKSARRRFFIVGVDGLKAQILTRLSRGRTIRFSNALDASYFEQLASERRVVRYSRGRPVARFERVPGRRAEALDAIVYAFAARAALNLNFEVREDQLRSVVPLPARPPAVIRSNFMERGRAAAR